MNDDGGQSLTIKTIALYAEHGILLYETRGRREWTTVQVH